MGKISLYATAQPALEDRLIGTDNQNSNVTKNFQIGDILALGTSVSQVVSDVVPSGSSLLTVSSYLQYGINVITQSSVDDYALRMPIPPTKGKQVVVINLSSGPIVLYPSMSGGSINGSIDGSFVIPNNGLSYVFFCYENPAPGAWSMMFVPSVNQYDSGIITANMLGPNYDTDVFSASDALRVVQSSSFYGNSGWGYNGINNPLYLVSTSGTPYVAFKPSVLWNAITKVSVYTNMAVDYGQTFGLYFGSAYSYYNSGTTSPIVAANNYLSGSAGSPSYGNATTPLPGTAPSSPLTPNVGDPGTMWGELIYSSNPIQIGDVLLQTNINIPGHNNVDQWSSRYINFCFQPKAQLSGIKFKFIIDYI